METGHEADDKCERRGRQRHGRRVRETAELPDGPGREHSVIILVADGVRPDTLTEGIAAGRWPALARLAQEGGAHTVTTCFPSVTGPAYVPLLTGQAPGPAGLPGIRWFDRERRGLIIPHRARSYVGAEMRHADADLDASVPTLFERVQGDGVASMSVFGRGLRRRDRLDQRVSAMAQTSIAHFRGRVEGWLRLDDDAGSRFVASVLSRRPRVAFAAFLGPDKAAHADTHTSPLVSLAIDGIDRVADALRQGLESTGRWSTTTLWVVSDHGHSPVHTHDEIADVIRALDYRVLAHPWVYSPRRASAAVMVSGNAMAHVYVDLAARGRPGWDRLAAKHEPLAKALLARESIDLMMLPCAGGRCEVRRRDGGVAIVTMHATHNDVGRFSYEPIGGDPLGIGRPLVHTSADAAWDATRDTAYPDSVVQIALLAGSSRAGDILLSASPGWDLRERYEPIPHRSAHGGLRAEQMLVPALVNRPCGSVLRRTTDIGRSAARSIGAAPIHDH